MRVGVIGVQGDVSEHIAALRAALNQGGRSGDAIPVRRPRELESCHALTIPGGESTTISKLLLKSGLHDVILRRAEEGLPILGTCAGCILLAKEGDDQVRSTQTRLLGLMDMTVDRNAFGRQRDSFEREFPIDGLDQPFRGVFIRSPSITRTWGSCTPLARIDDVVVLARQGDLWAACFHPELSQDPRIHVAFLASI